MIKNNNYWELWRDFSNWKFNLRSLSNRHNVLTVLFSEDFYHVNVAEIIQILFERETVFVCEWNCKQITTVLTN